MDQAPKMVENPVDWDELYPGRFLKAGDLKGRKVVVVIDHVHVEELVGDKGPQMKGIIRFKGKDKQMALNKTNGLCLKAMFGRVIPDWTGKRVTLHAAQWNGEPCIRIWGSPDLAADMPVTIALPRKRPMEMVMHKNGTGTAPAREAGDDSDGEP